MTELNLERGGFDRNITVSRYKPNIEKILVDEGQSLGALINWTRGSRETRNVSATSRFCS